MLCTRYTESKQSIVELLQMLLMGKLGGCVSKGALEASSLPYNTKSLLRNFVQACIDSDADSAQSRRAREWMAQLVVSGGVSWQPEHFTSRDRAAVVAIISHLFNRAPAQEQSDDPGRGSTTADESSRRPGCHDTLYLSSAYVTLAAAANGVDAIVECVTSSGLIFIPHGKTPGSTTFVTRLWLTQTPRHVLDILHDADSNHADDDLSNLQNHTSYMVIFGGVSEITTFIAGQLGLHSGPGDDDISETLRCLWQAGVGLAHSCVWTITNQYSGIIKAQGGKQEYHALNESGKRKSEGPRYGWNDLHFRLEARHLTQDIQQPAVTLARELKKYEARFDKGARAIADRVHSIWRLRSYDGTFESSFAETNLGAAMLFVATSMGIEAVQMLTSVSGGSLSQYALAAYTFELRLAFGLQHFIPRAMDHYGVPVHDVLFTAAILWGGMTSSPRPVSGHDEAGLSSGYVGIVAPQCTVVLSILKDPWTLAKRGFDGPIIHVCHGSVPLLPRSPSTGCKWGKPNQSDREGFA